MMPEVLQELQQQLGYNFKRTELLECALSHSSYVNEQQGQGKSNERLEFLGDSVLGFIAAEYFYKNRADLPEGELTKLRANAVCETSLCGYARSLELGRYLLLGKGEAVTGGRERPSILADAFEAVIAAIYLDSGLKAAQKFVLSHIQKQPEGQAAFRDYKTILQEIVQRNPEERLEYVLAGESGPAHERLFAVEIHLNSNVVGRGEGRSKKAAEQAAAKEALALFGQG